MALQGTLPKDVWDAHNKGYSCDMNSRGAKLAREYLEAMHFCDSSAYNHSADCTYPDNFCHVDKRGDQLFFRPSSCTKFRLKAAEPYYGRSDYLTSYHGTPSSSVSSILEHGLLPAGEYIDGKMIAKRNGEALGYGVYTSPSPLYAQLYAPVERWRGYYVQTILMVRQPANDVTSYQDEGCRSSSLIGRNDIWRLYGGNLGPGQLQMRTRNYQQVVIQAVLVKIQEQDPEACGGEYYRIREALERIPR
jgi:hypothetical protein